MSRTNLRNMSPNKRTALIERLSHGGMTPDLATAFLKASDRDVRDWIRDCPPARAPRYAYNAAMVLGFRSTYHVRHVKELPEAEPGEMILVYGGWSMMDLYNNALIVKDNLLSFTTHDLFERENSWTKEGFPPGIYRLRLTTGGNICDSFEKRHQTHLWPGEKIPPTCLVGTAILTHRLATGQWLIDRPIGCEEPRRVVSFERERGRDSMCLNEREANGMEMPGYRLVNSL